MLIIGHRGAGLDDGSKIDMVELDLRKSVREIVVHHDRIGKKSGQKLTEVLQTITLPINLELKETGFEEELLGKLKSFSSEVLISSKYPLILKKIRTLDENTRLGLILGSANFFLLPIIPRLDEFIKLYSIHPKAFLLHARIARYLKSLDKKIFAWTVNDPKVFEKLKKLGIDGVFTDQPDIIRNYE